MNINPEMLRAKGRQWLRGAMGWKRPPVRPATRELYRAIGSLRNWSSRDVVLDVGANIGQTTLGLQPYLNGAKVLAFEPVAASFAELTRRTSRLHHVKRFKLALGDQPGVLAIHHHATRGAMSSFRPWWKSAGSEEVEVSTVDRVLAEQALDFVHLMKIDTEGYELDVLNGAVEALDAARIAIIQVEVGVDPRVWAWTCLEDVQRLLAPRGYYLHGFFESNLVRARAPAGWEERERATDPKILKRCNALFVCAEFSSRRPVQADPCADGLEPDNHLRSRK